MKETMKGLVKETGAPGAVLRTDLAVPRIGDGEVLVKVKMTAICGTDLHIYRWNDWAKARVPVPMIFGHEFAGEVVRTGKSVRSVSEGMRVAGETHIPCGSCYQCQTGNQHNCEHMKILGVHVPGAFCEYVAVPEACVWRLEDEIDDRTGAMLEPMGVAVHGVMSGEVSARNVLILGCGPIGVMAVGAAAAAGASKVLAADIFEEKLAMAAAMGADVLLNTREEGWKEKVLQETGGRGADVVIDYTGNSRLIEEAFPVLAKGGRFTLVGLPSHKLELDLTNQVIYKEANINGVTGRRMYETWYQCVSLLQSGKCDIRRIIGGEYPLEEFEQAFADLESGKPGKMLLSL